MKKLRGSPTLFFSLENGEISCRVDYTITSDDLVATRSLSISLTSAQKDIIRQFAVATAMPKIKEKEGID